MRRSSRPLRPGRLMAGVTAFGAVLAMSVVVMGEPPAGVSDGASVSRGSQSDDIAATDVHAHEVGVGSGSWADGQDVGSSDDDRIVWPIYVPLLEIRRTSDARYPDDLLRKYLDHHSAGQHELAAETAIRLTMEAPDDPLGYYNLACSYSRLQRFDEAFVELAKAVDRGWWYALHTERDPDLRGLRLDPQFEMLLERVREQADARRPAPAPVRADGWVDIARDLEAIGRPLVERERVVGVTLAAVCGDRIHVWSVGTRDLANTDALHATDRYRLRTPSQLLMLFGLAKASVDHEIPLEELSRALLDARDARRDPGPIARTGSRVHLAGRPRGRVVEGSSSAGLSSYALGCNEIESATAMSFRGYCREHILTPLGMTDTEFDGPRADAGPRPGGVRLVSGHTRFGTPVASSGGGDTSGAGHAAGDPTTTTARDLARLVRVLMGETPTAAAAGELIRLGRSLGLDVMHATDADGFEIVELVDSLDGQGCLIRWYPAHDRGVVVLYNTETGGPVARHLAHLVLGGPTHE